MSMESTGRTVGYQGVPGAYSEEALLSFLPFATPVPRRTLHDVFLALSAGEIVLWVHAREKVVSRYATEEGGDQPSESVLADHVVDLCVEQIHSCTLRSAGGRRLAR